MKTKRELKRTLAGVLSVTMLTGNVPANLGGLLGESLNIAHVAAADVLLSDLTFRKDFRATDVLQLGTDYKTFKLVGGATGNVNGNVTIVSIVKEGTTVYANTNKNFQIPLGTTEESGDAPDVFYLVNGNGTAASPYEFSYIQPFKLTLPTGVEVAYNDGDTASVNTEAVIKSVDLTSSSPFILKNGDGIVGIAQKTGANGSYELTNVTLTKDSTVSPIVDGMIEVEDDVDLMQAIDFVNSGNYAFASDVVPTIKLMANLTPTLTRDLTVNITESCKIDLNGKNLLAYGTNGEISLEVSGANKRIEITDTSEVVGFIKLRSISVAGGANLVLDKANYQILQNLTIDKVSSAEIKGGNYILSIGNANFVVESDGDYKGVLKITDGTFDTWQGYLSTFDPVCNEEWNGSSAEYDSGDGWYSYLPDKFYGIEKNETGDVKYIVKASYPAEKDKGLIDKTGFVYLQFAKGDESATYGANEIRRYNGELFEIDKDSSVLIRSAYKQRFYYLNTAGEEKDLNTTAGYSEEGKTVNGTFIYEYRFTMPGYDVKHEAVDKTVKIADSSLKEANFNHINGAIGDTNVPIPDNQVHVGTKLEFTSTEKLSVGVDTGDGFVNCVYKEGNTPEGAQFVSEEYTAAVDATPASYKYTFIMPNADVTVKAYEHEHDFEVTESDNVLWVKCINNQDDNGTVDDGCVLQNKKVKVAELTGSDTYAYGAAVNVTLEKNDSDANSPWTEAGSVEGVLTYYNADKYGEPIKGEGKYNSATPPTEVGSYVAVQTIQIGTKNYTITLPFDINAKSVAHENVSITADWEYNYVENEAQGPELVVKDGVKLLTEGTDYVVTGTRYAKDSGTYKITIIGVGNYTGSVVKEWSIKDNTRIPVTLDMFNISYEVKNGYASVKVDPKEGKITTADYKVSGTRTVNEGGTYTITIYGKNLKTGSVTTTWTVKESEFGTKAATVKKVTYDSASKKLDINSKMYIPDGAKMTKAGLIATSNGDKKYGLTLATTPVAGETFVKANANDVSNEKEYAFTWRKSSVSDGQTWYAVPYVCYTKDGKTETVYGDLVEAKVAGGAVTYKTIELGNAKLGSSSYDSTEKKLTFVNRMSVPKDCTMVSAGICATKNASKKDSLSVSTAEVANETYIKKSTSDLTAAKTFTYTWKKNKVNVGDTWYVKAYVTYKDASGKENTVYGDLETVKAELDADD